MALVQSGTVAHSHWSIMENNLMVWRKYNNKLRKLFSKKRELLNTILFLNTAFSVIDKMFLQEIANAEIKKKNKIRFLLYGFFSIFCRERSKFILPNNYIPVEESGGELLQKIMNFPEKTYNRE